MTLQLPNTLTFGSLFAGIGGFDLGFERAGMKCEWQVEVNERCRDVLSHHWPAVARYEDVRNVGRDELSTVDVVCGGFPCQDVSVAGRREGLAGERSGLWFEFHRILTELEPRYIVIENVPGLLSSNKGRDFATILGALIGATPDNGGESWEKAGIARGPGPYRVAWRVLDAQYFGVAQRRRRVFIVGSLGDGRCAEILFERKGSAGDSPPRREAGTRVTNTLAPGAHGGFTGQDAKNGNVAIATRETAQSLTSSYAKQPDNSDTNLGPTLAVAIRGRESGAQPFIAGTLSTSGAGTARTGNGNEVDLLAFDYAIGGSNRTQPARTGGDYAQLQANRPDAIAGPRVGVRRLTPVECERLQGFPDGWTAGHSDSARYQMLGNAVCINVAEWIGKRIVEIENDLAMA